MGEKDDEIEKRMRANTQELLTGFLAEAVKKEQIEQYHPQEIILAMASAAALTLRVKELDPREGTDEAAGWCRDEIRTLLDPEQADALLESYGFDPETMARPGGGEGKF